MVFAGQCFANQRFKENSKDEAGLCSGAKFVLGHYEERRDSFNDEPMDESRYISDTTAINTFLTTGKVSAKPASMATKETVARAIMGTALIHQGQITTLSDHFNTLKETDLFYRHYKALSILEDVANFIVNVEFSGEEVDKESNRHIANQYFSELESLSGIGKDTFGAWFKSTVTEHEAGLCILFSVEGDPEFLLKQNYRISKAIRLFNKNKTDDAKKLLEKARD